MTHHDPLFAIVLFAAKRSKPMRLAAVYTVQTFAAATKRTREDLEDLIERGARYVGESDHDTVFFRDMKSARKWAKATAADVAEAVAERGNRVEFVNYRTSPKQRR